jgi:MFS family permease
VKRIDGVVPGAHVVLFFLTLINLFNYIDRQLLYAVFPAIQSDLGLSDTQLGAVASAFMVVYLIASPLFGWFGDRWPRMKIVAVSTTLWSAATTFTGGVANIAQLFFARALVGIGEAGYGPVSPSLVSDYFPKRLRGSRLAIFYLAIPVGSAAGYILGGMLEGAFGWRAAFLIVGIPGIILGTIAWSRSEPERGQSEGLVGAEPPPLLETCRMLLHTRSYVLNTLAMAAMTFAVGGLATWFPSFLVREHGLDLGYANTMFGGITLAAGVLGTVVGGALGDLSLRYTRGAYFLVSGVGLLLSVPAAAVALSADDPRVYFSAIFVAETLVFLNTGPLNALLANVVSPAIRSTAFAVNILVIHLLGDALSPTIIGMLSDRVGLRSAFMIAPAMLAVAGLVCLLGIPRVGPDMERMESLPRLAEA